MYIIDGIAYAGECPKPIGAKSIRPLEDYKLLILFSNGERRVFDFKPLLDMPCYKPLWDIDTFRQVYVECGTAVWDNGEIDIAPETLFEESVLVSGEAIA